MISGEIVWKINSYASSWSILIYLTLSGSEKQKEADGIRRIGSTDISDETNEKAINSWRLDVQWYTQYLLEQGHSHPYVNQAISALRFLSKEVLKQSAQKHDYIRPKSEKKLPYVLSEEEVLLILQAVDNLKHRAMLYLAYSSGLRVSEVVRLKISNLDISRSKLFARQGKGRKDRCTMLSNATWKIVQAYILREQPGHWLFPLWIG